LADVRIVRRQSAGWHSRRKQQHATVNNSRGPSLAADLRRSQWRVVALASLGGSLEYYDFVIYGIFAQYIARQFFPASDSYVSLILSFSVLAIGFLARPIGGIVLSGLGDRYGRRPVFLGSLFCMTAATILVGVLPSQFGAWPRRCCSLDCV
jgi:MFS family permease